MKISTKKTLIIFVFCLLIGSFLWFQYALCSNIIIKKAAIASLSKEKATLREAISRKYALLIAYKDVVQKVGTFQFSFPTDNVAFFAALEGIMASSSLKIIAINPISRSCADYVTAVRVTCEGDCYELLDAISRMRNSKMIMRLSSLEITEKDKDCVRADILIETIIHRK
ncbi:MAG: hypothetical protein KBH34_01625 [Acetomicrobium sp.]|uniref:Uncharacterized protein n=1 Tax=Acetomicrobium flavidum TaxID=49896 RepID=A0ABY1JDI4_9BACT|nr:hypothetical protein [Acetomicrobium sp.]SIN69018.1 hypothetical protein SAMN05444368_1214 [Acetomicrobium flavidum]